MRIMPVELEKLRFLVMCSSKSRPHRLVEMVNSFSDTKSDFTEMMIYVSNQDSKIEDYRNILPRLHGMYPDVGYEISDPKTMVGALNHFSCSLIPWVQYYSEVNDDHVYRTKGWDLAMAQAALARNDWAFVHGWTQNLPTAVMITGKIVRALGFFFPPVFIHTHIDNYYIEIGELTGMGVFLPHVVIEHLHPMFGKAALDETYNWVFSGERFSEGERALADWRENYKDEHVQRLKEAMEKNEVANR